MILGSFGFFPWVQVVIVVLEAGEGARAHAPLGVTLLGLAEWKAFGNSFSHSLATVMLQSVSAFLLDKASVGTPLLR